MLIVQIKNGNIERGLKELKGKFLKTKEVATSVLSTIVTPYSFLVVTAEPDILKILSKSLCLLVTNFSDIDSKDVNAIILLF